MICTLHVNIEERPVGPADETVEQRLLALTSLVETLPDIREAVANADADVASLVDQVQRLVDYLRRRQDSTGLDAADYLATRLTLQTLAGIAVHLRRGAQRTNEQLAAGTRQLRELTKELARVRTEFTSADANAPES